ncbi:WD-REPEATS-REGION domain-containing protein [Mycena chlorophos]|uniref:WD-REPEATS-REGION domain-containing protein n=1 Tax=Mycena chlorophos TaxID=658473 RepID=A0A8H6TQS7_MYCCL|nr:WD-REPEATS-REGION domain-containing protein [Mycena chlorophos]
MPLQSSIVSNRKRRPYGWLVFARPPCLRTTTSPSSAESHGYRWSCVVALPSGTLLTTHKSWSTCSRLGYMPFNKAPDRVHKSPRCSLKTPRAPHPLVDLALQPSSNPNLTMDTPGPSRRKRVNSDAETVSDRSLKRTRTMPPPPVPLLSPGLTRSTSQSSIDLNHFPFDPEERAARRASRPPNSSASSASGTSRTSVQTDRSSDTRSLVRSASFSSFHPRPQDPASTKSPNLPHGSARYYLRATRLTLDFSVGASSQAAAAVAPVVPEANATVAIRRNPVPLAYSGHQILYFSRANRVQYRPMGYNSQNAEVGQLCRIQDKHGELVVLQAGGLEQRTGIVALATSTGSIQLWDTEMKKLVMGWTVKGVSSLAWSGAVVTVGTEKGSVRHYDTRIQPTTKMKEQAMKITRHEGRVGVLQWNADGRLLASGDDNGVVFTWDSRTRTPLDVGEYHMRRKKIQHNGEVSALAWCPWQPKLLATGDTQGAVKFWNVDDANPSSNAMTPAKFETGSAMVGLHFSTNFKELLTTVGPAAPREVIDANSVIWPLSSDAVSTNAVHVYSFPTLRPVTRESVPLANETSVVAGSVLSPISTNAPQKVVVALPAEGKLKVYDVWGSRKREIRRQASCLEASIR